MTEYSHSVALRDVLVDAIDIISGPANLFCAIHDCEDCPMYDKSRDRPFCVVRALDRAESRLTRLVIDENAWRIGALTK